MENCEIIKVIFKATEVVILYTSWKTNMEIFLQEPEEKKTD